MAGMLPGVESARRRRLRGWSDPSSLTASVSGSGFGSARMSRLSLSSHDTHLTPTSFFTVNEDEKLGGAAREAKERLDGRLRGHLKQEIRKSRSTNPAMAMEDLQLEIFRSKKNGLNWGKKWLRWKSLDEQDECAICLDQVKRSEKIAQLRCAHRFHSECLLPWLESTAHCPCCRATVFGSS
ncbi:hypothetical protein SSX86_026218 [Deinandra increscens subsp. villosa]|uniref:RING-type domain-containing protein n=1 Tax=Deinandra increscens subsp. villosa TaxID=3103831 RepID=A0AAP0CEG7_9ASTR